jgi:hypothetical protein
MSSLQRRKAQPQVSPALEVVGLMREAVEHLAAIRRRLDEDRTPIEHQPGETVQPQMINGADLTTFQIAAGEAGVSEKTVRRWYQDHPEIGITVAGAATYIYRSKLRAYLATR